MTPKPEYGRSAGRELDAEIAERIFGRRMLPDDCRDLCCLREYSESVAAAFLVVEAMRAKVVKFEITWHSGQTRARTVRTTALGERRPRDFIVTDEVRPAEPYWEAIVLTAAPEYYGAWSRRLIATADTPALAICLCALAALDALPSEKAAVGPALDSLTTETEKSNG